MTEAVRLPREGVGETFSLAKMVQARDLTF